ncbi:energy transducer TonB family protein [Lutibacter flavus]|uniref:Outer membrane transport energization protein TonB n=1 Tax=Lutibacter flavus TaxID=691689 RepID=A0A238XWV5_9FLAO|nr:energy transducer TonB [Lutibacter flavus]SNR63058.1 outer membrane transport energization protein TonB [Lutibacter flavus]
MFSFLNTKYKRKSAALTSVIMSLLLIALFFFGMKYLDPPEEYGIAVNFGTSNVGSGNVQPTEPLKAAVSEEKVIEEQQEEVQEISEPKVVEEAITKSEDVATQDNEEAIAIKKEQEAKKKADEIAKKVQLEKERVEREKQAAIAKQRAEEEAKRRKLDALIGGVSNSDGTATGGEGNDNQSGDKGSTTGDPNASGYYGNGGSGSGGDYQLGNRKPLSRPKPNYICNEEGLVVVSIEVDVNGRVIKATPGVKGSTNTAACLLSQAKEAALKTKWQPDAKAPSKQVGTIKYRFSLSQ